MSTTNKAFRIVSAPPVEAEVQVNALASDYSVVAWAFSQIGDAVVVTAVMQSTADLMRQAYNAQRAAGPIMMPRH
jgi:hypothetical protein